MSTSKTSCAATNERGPPPPTVGKKFGLVVTMVSAARAADPRRHRDQRPAKALIDGIDRQRKPFVMLAPVAKERLPTSLVVVNTILALIGLAALAYLISLA